MPSDAVLIALGSGGLTFLGICVSGVTAVLVARLNSKATAAAVEVGEVKKKTAQAAEAVEEVKTTLEHSNTAVTKQLTDIHTLVNSKWGAMLKAYAEALREKAIISNKQEDIDAADKADADVRDHENQQKIVDSTKLNPNQGEPNE